jgi:hypothetical protein
VGVSFINKKAPVRRLFEPEAFHLGLEKTFLMTVIIERIKSFLAKRRLPQFGHEANKDTYSVSLVLFQLCEHDKHFIFHPLFDPEAFQFSNPFY